MPCCCSLGHVLTDHWLIHVSVHDSLANDDTSIVWNGCASPLFNVWWVLSSRPWPKVKKNLNRPTDSAFFHLGVRKQDVFVFFLVRPNPEVSALEPFQPCRRVLRQGVLPFPISLYVFREDLVKNGNCKNLSMHLRIGSKLGEGSHSWLTSTGRWLYLGKSPCRVAKNC